MMEYMEAKMQDRYEGYDAAFREVLAQRDELLATVRQYACSCVPEHCAMSDDGGSEPVDEQLCGRRARDAIAKAEGRG
jgi:hypothetical protein